MSMGPSWDNPFPGNYQPFPGLYGNGAPAPGVVSPSLGVTPPEDSFDKQDKEAQEKKEPEEKQHPWYVGFAKEALKTGLTVGASVLGGMFGGVPGAIAAGAAASGIVNAVDQKISKGKVDWGSVLIDAALGTIPGGVGSAVVRTGEKAIAKFTGKELAEKAAERTLKRAAAEGAVDGALMGYVGGTAQEAYQNYKETGHMNLGQASTDGLDSILPGMLGGAFAGSAFTALGRRMQQHREAKAYKASIKEPAPEHLQQLKPPKISQANRLAGTFLLKPSEDPLLYNFRKVDKHVYRGGMPDSGEAFHRLRHEHGVTTIIDLRGLETTEQAHIDYEAAWAKHQGMEHVWIPMDSTKAPTHQQLMYFFAAIEDAKRSGGKVYVHCKHGIDRTGSAIHAYEVLSGKPQADAYRNMQENGFNWLHARSRPEQQDFALGDDLPDIVHKAHSGAKVGLEAETLLARNQISTQDSKRVFDFLAEGEVTQAENLLSARVPDRTRIFKEPPPKPVKPKQSKAGDQFVKTETIGRSNKYARPEDEPDTWEEEALPKKLTLNLPKPKSGSKNHTTHTDIETDASVNALEPSRAAHSKALNILKNNSDIILKRLRRMTSEDLEKQHDFIQYAFPTSKKSSVIAEAPTLSAKMINEIQQSPVGIQLRKNQMEAFGILAENHFGLGLSPDGLYIKNSKLLHQKLAPGDHNNARISRILRSLNEFGNMRLSKQLMGILEQEYSKDVQMASSLRQWRYHYEDSLPIERQTLSTNSSDSKSRTQRNTLQAPPVKLLSQKTSNAVVPIFRKGSPQDRQLGAMFGIACGDALGAPFEGLTAAEIKRKCPKGVTLALRGGSHNTTHSYHYLPGETTDDTLFAKLTHDLLLDFKAQGKDLSNAAVRDSFYREYLSRLSHYIENGAQGFGQTTTSVINRFKQSPKADFSELVSKTIIANGNAPILRSIPFALSPHINDKLLDTIVEEFVQITHRATPTPRPRQGSMRTPLEQDLKATVAATKATCRVVRRLQQENVSVTDKVNIQKIYMDVAKEIEQDSPEMAKLIRHLVKTSNSASYKTSILTEHLPQNGKTIETDGVSRESWNTARLSLWALLHHNDAGAALLDVIGKGGDTDSNAALTGALFGVTEGQGGLPAILENGLLKQNAKFKNPESQTNFNQRHRKGYLIYKNDDRNIKTTQRAFI